MTKSRVLSALLASCLLSASAGAVLSAPRDVAEALSRLSAASALERASAERELARLLVSADAPLLAATLRTASAEVRSRIASALMSSARHFSIAAELAASGEDPVAGTGADALAGLAAAWLGASDQDPQPMSVVREATFSGAWSLDVHRSELELTLDRIARLVDARRSDRPGVSAPALVLDPRYEGESARPLPGSEEIVSPVAGSFEELVLASAVTHGAVFDVYGWSEGRSWFVVRAASHVNPPPAQALLRAWVLAVARPISVRSARAAARALASTGWPAALDWLDLRWREGRDPAALDGLVLAAGRGGLGASLATREGAEVLLARADRALEQAGEDHGEAREVARALLTLGSIGSEAWAGGFVRATARGRSLRCALVASARSCPAEFAALLEERLMAGDTTAEERCAVLRALAALGQARGKDLAVPGLDAAFEWAANHGYGRAFPMALRTLGVREPSEWQSADRLPPGTQLELCADALGRMGSEAGAERLAGARLAALIRHGDGEALALALLDRESLWLSRLHLRGGLLAARSAGADPAAIHRLLVCADLATSEELSELAADLFARAQWTAADWLQAGATIASAGGELDIWPRETAKTDEHYSDFLGRLELVRDRLLAAQKAADPPSKPAPVPAELQGMQAGWVQGCARTITLLRARQSEPGAREFLRRLRVLFQRVQHPLRRELTGRFPAPSPALLVDVEAREPWVGF